VAATRRVFLRGRRTEPESRHIPETWDDFSRCVSWTLGEQGHAWSVLLGAIDSASVVVIDDDGVTQERERVAADPGDPGGR